jgi:hypothetical protein
MYLIPCILPLHLKNNTMPVTFTAWQICFKAVFFQILAFVTTLWEVGVHADHLRVIPHTGKCMQMNRGNIIPVVKVTITTFFLHASLKQFLK